MKKVRKLGMWEVVFWITVDFLEDSSGKDTNDFCILKGKKTYLKAW